MIVGAGQTGQAVARYLSGQNQSFLLADDNLSAERISPVSALPGFVEAVPLTQESVARGQRVVVSPGVPLSHPALAMVDSHKLTNDIAIFAEAAAAPIVAITGSNGKSTVTQLVGEMASACLTHVGVGGNIGVPCLDLIDAGSKLYVLELSSYHLEIATQLPVEVAAILNLSPDHQDRYDGVQQYYRTKGNILNCAARLVLNRSILSQYEVSGRDVVTFGQDKPVRDADFGLLQDDSGIWLVQGEDRLIHEEQLKVKGAHNLENVLAALAIGSEVGLDRDTMLQVAANFTGLPHRSEIVGEQNGVTWVNDSKATNVGSALAAITGLGGDKNTVLIAGGDAKGADFSMLVPAIADHCKLVITLGKDGKAIADVADSVTAIAPVQTLREAVTIAANSALAGDLVLLSPACASTDMFRDFKDRGDQFRTLVQEFLS